MSVLVEMKYSPEQGAPEEEVVIEVTRDWSPLGADRFLAMVKDGLYDGCKMHRVVPNFIVQLGIAADPKLQAKWQVVIDDDPFKVHNDKGTVSFAKRGPDTRSTQIFVNVQDNRGLDEQGFTPFGRVVKGLSALERSFAGYAHGDNKPDASRIKAEGNAYLDKHFPKLGTFGACKVSA
eukprot:TRINITY_DN20378_c0_g1_i1.p1 TRINITY_DN20378_c0_g1~~TRINITY_DN20378_c0_g1_i1.p1  ORF type:complete len:191 (+),score=89.04 TRINITY_DN20378_c0_g1_i1:41-574(+)